jgi:hypothetical protein
MNKNVITRSEYKGECGEYRFYLLRWDDRDNFDLTVIKNSTMCSPTRTAIDCNIDGEVLEGLAKFLSEALTDAKV